MAGRDLHIPMVHRSDRALADEFAEYALEAAPAYESHGGDGPSPMQEPAAAPETLTLRPVAFPERRPAPHSGWCFAAPVAVLGAAVTMALVLRAPGSPVAGSQASVASVRLLLDRGQPDAVETLASGDAIYPGDCLRASYTAMHDGFGAVLARDRAGSAFTYVPSHGSAMVALPAGKDLSFPESTVLGGVLGTEKVVVLWCNAARELGPFLENLRSNRPLASPRGCEVHEVVLAKRGAP